MKRNEATGNMPVQSDSPSQTQPIQRAALHHRAGDAWRYATPDGSVTLRLRAAAGNLSKVEVFYGKRYDPAPEPACKSVSMIRRLCDGIHDWFEVRIAPEDPRLFYFFRLTGQGPAPEVCHLQESGLYDEPTLSNRNLFFFFPYILPGDIHDLPEWARGASIYQIFPDRFARAEGFGGTRAPVAGDSSDGAPARSGHDFYGGNLEGIRQRIPHLCRWASRCCTSRRCFSPSPRTATTPTITSSSIRCWGTGGSARLTAELHRTDPCGARARVQPLRAGFFRLRGCAGKRCGLQVCGLVLPRRIPWTCKKRITPPSPPQPTCPSSMPPIPMCATICARWDGTGSGRRTSTAGASTWRTRWIQPSGATSGRRAARKGRRRHHRAKSGGTPPSGWVGTCLTE